MTATYLCKMHGLRGLGGVLPKTKRPDFVSSTFGEDVDPLRLKNSPQGGSRIDRRFYVRRSYVPKVLREMQFACRKRERPRVGKACVFVARH